MEYGSGGDWGLTIKTPSSQPSPHRMGRRSDMGRLGINAWILCRKGEAERWGIGVMEWGRVWAWTLSAGTSCEICRLRLRESAFLIETAMPFMGLQ
jgi:hypothetical protein